MNFVERWLWYIALVMLFCGIIVFFYILSLGT